MDEEVTALPPVTERPCKDCPWAEKSMRGWLGPYSAETWLQAVHGEAPIACHKTIVNVDEEGVGDWEDPKMRQCFGAAQYRANVFKMPHNPQVARAKERDTSIIFGSDREFLNHHLGD